MLRKLHWLPVRQRVVFKIATLVHRSLSGNAPGYLADDCQLVADARWPRVRQLRVLPTLVHSLLVGRPAVLGTGLRRRRTTSLEQSAAQSQTMWAVIRPVQAVNKDIFIRTVRPRRSANCV